MDPLIGLIIIYLLVLFWFKNAEDRKREKEILGQLEKLNYSLIGLNKKINYLEERINSLPIDKILNFNMVKSFEEIRRSINSILETTSILIQNQIPNANDPENDKSLQTG